jgi:hypothetical protein
MVSYSQKEMVNITGHQQKGTGIESCPCLKGNLRQWQRNRKFIFLL